ncbi:MAG: hypothetical protein ABI451_00020 [Dokdonella sp.]
MPKLITTKFPPSSNGRRLLFAVALAASWLILLGWAAGVSWNSPLKPQETQHFDGAQLRIVMGGGAEDGNALQIGAVGEQRTALQSVLVTNLRAEDNAILRYRFDQFPRTLELAFLFRRSDAPDDVHVVTLPWPGTLQAAFDLRDVPEWRGEISEIGFVESPTPQLIPTQTPFAPFRIVSIDLSSPSWLGGLRALRQDWFGYRPWGLYAVSMESAPDMIRRPSLIIVLSAAIITMLAWGALLIGWREQRAKFMLVVAIAFGWLLLDATWLSQLQKRVTTTWQVYAGKSWDERRKLVPDDDVLRAAERAKKIIAAVPGTPKVLVHSGSVVEAVRFYYQMLPINAALLVPVLAVLRAPLAEGTFIILYDVDGWDYSAKTRQLTAPGVALTAVPWLDEGTLRIFRIAPVSTISDAP